MSSRKFSPYENKKEIAGRKNFVSPQYSEIPPGSFIQYRNVHPQFSEPEEYIFCKSNPSQFQQTANISCQKTSDFTLNKSWNNFISNISAQKENAITLPLYQSLPTFRQYLNEENSEILDIQNITTNSSQLNRHKDICAMKGNVTLQLNTNNEDQKSAKKVDVKNQKVLIGMRFRHMTGSVDQVIRWYKTAKNSELEIHYEVAGILESTIKKGGTQLLLIRSESGHILQGVFYSIDRELPNFPSGTLITATGDMVGSNKMHVYDANKISKEDFIAVQRLAFLSQRAMEEAYQRVVSV